MWIRISYMFSKESLIFFFFPPQYCFIFFFLEHSFSYHISFKKHVIKNRQLWNKWNKFKEKVKNNNIMDVDDKSYLRPFTISFIAKAVIKFSTIVCVYIQSTSCCIFSCYFIWFLVDRPDRLWHKTVLRNKTNSFSRKQLTYFLLFSKFCRKKIRHRFIKI